MRMIDADALKEKIVDNSYLITYDYEFKSVESGMSLTGIQQAIDEMPTVEQSRWIPCSERLPEKSGYYLCTMTEEHAQHPTGLEICEYDEYIEEFGFWYERFDKTSLGSLGSEWEELYVLAWTTLPDAYKEREDKE